MTKTLDSATGYDFTNKYYADRRGQVFFNINTGMGAAKRSRHDPVKYFINKYGYIEYILSDKNNNRKHISAHRIVASLFIENPENKSQVNHIDGIKTNNDVSNLEWCTPSENERHSVDVLGKTAWNKGKEMQKGKDYKGQIRTVYRFSINGVFEKEYFNPTAAKDDGYNLKHISACCNGRAQSHRGKIWSYNKTLDVRKPKRKTPGVTYRKDTGKYNAAVVYKGITTRLGCYSTKLDAIEARNKFLDENPTILIRKTIIGNNNED